MPIPLLTLAGIYAGGKAIEGIANWWGAKSAADTQSEAAQRAQGQVENYYNKAAGYQQPYYQRGTQAYQRLGDQIDSGYYNMPQENFAPDNFNFEADPGYQFRLGEGQRAVESSAAAKGNYLSGATLKALTRYNQGFASNEYSNAFGRFNTNRNFAYNNFIDSYNRRSNELGNQYNRMASLANTGVGAAGTLSNLATGAGEQVAGIMGQGANARAAGQMGMANALGGIGGNIGEGALALGYLQTRSAQPQNNNDAPRFYNFEQQLFNTLGDTGNNGSAGYAPQYEDNVGFGSNKSYYLGR